MGIVYSMVFSCDGGPGSGYPYDARPCPESTIPAAFFAACFFCDPRQRSRTDSLKKTGAGGARLFCVPAAPGEALIKSCDARCVRYGWMGGAAPGQGRFLGQERNNADAAPDTT